MMEITIKIEKYQWYWYKDEYIWEDELWELLSIWYKIKKMDMSQAQWWWDLIIFTTEFILIK